VAKVREVYSSRTIGIDYSDDVQRIIDDNPTTVDVWRPTGNTALGAASPVKVATFQSRIETYKPPLLHGGEKVTGGGFTSNHYYLLLARVGTDSSGRTIDIKHRDTVMIGTTLKFLVLNVITYLDSSKTEAVLNVTE
jgi:hypothetical protein